MTADVDALGLDGVATGRQAALPVVLDDADAHTGGAAGRYVIAVGGLCGAGQGDEEGEGERTDSRIPAADQRERRGVPGLCTGMCVPPKASVELDGARGGTCRHVMV